MGKVSVEAKTGTPFSRGRIRPTGRGQTFVRPTCCVDLREGVADWIRLTRSWGSSWESVESGHPGVLARVIGQAVQISTQQDDFPQEIPVAVQVNIDHLQRAADAGAVEIRRFAKRLEARMRDRGYEDPGPLARTIAGLEPEDFSVGAELSGEN